MPIERPQPIVTQVSQILRKRIREGVYLPGGRLPPESDLAAEFGISRTSLRTAMAALVSEGLIIRRQGNGTFVNKRTFEINSPQPGFWSYTEMISFAGFDPVVKLVSGVERLPAGDEAGHLETGSSEKIYSLERLFIADGKPVIYSNNIVPLRIINGDYKDFPLRNSISDFLRTYSGQEIAYSTSDIHAVTLPEEVANLMGKKPGEPLLKFTDIFYNRENQPLALGKNYYDDKVLAMRLVRARG